MQSDRIIRAFELIEEARHFGSADAKREQLGEVIETANASGHLQLGCEARTALIEVEVFDGQIERAIELFSWCLQQMNDHPVEVDSDTILWEYKWIGNKLCRFPDVSLERIDEILSDIADRFAVHGWSERAPHQIKMEHAIATGDRTEADRSFQLWRKAKYGFGADCPACEQDRMVEYWLFVDQERRALQAADPILQRSLVCAEVPHITIPRLLQTLLKRNETDLAYKLHRTGYRLVAASGDFMDAVASHLAYCGLTQLHLRGRQIVSRHCLRAVQSPDLMNSFHFFNAALLFTKTALRNVAGIRLELPMLPGIPSGEQLEAAAFWFETCAKVRAKALDRRNGNEHYTGLLNQSEALLNESWPKADASWDRPLLANKQSQLSPDRS
jgi:hypothetical protein